MGVRLTARLIEALRKPESPTELRDAEVKGLLLRVQPSGLRTFYVELARGRRVRLGRYPVLTVEGARQQALLSLSDFIRTGDLPSRKSRTRSLRDYIDRDYRNWATANLKWGAGAADRILAVFRGFSERPLASLDAFSIERWRTRRLKDGVSASTINRDIATLKSAVSKAQEWGIVTNNPLASVKQVKVDSTRVRDLSDEEEKRLRAGLADRDRRMRLARRRANDWRNDRCIDPLAEISNDEYAGHLSPAVIVSLVTGLRRGELTALTWEDVDLRNNVLTVRASAAKSGRLRRVPINAECKAVLQRWRAQTAPANARVFPIRDMKTAWTRLLRDVGIHDFRWHDLRHAFASKLVQRGVDLNTLRELLGHADLKMVLRYAHLRPGHLAEAVARLGDAT
jgi:integrase